MRHYSTADKDVLPAYDMRKATTLCRAVSTHEPFAYATHVYSACKSFHPCAWEGALKMQEWKMQE